MIELVRLLVFTLAGVFRSYSSSRTSSSVSSSKSPFDPDMLGGVFTTIDKSFSQISGRVIPFATKANLDDLASAP